MIPGNLPITVPTGSRLTPEYLFSQPRRNRPVLYIDRQIVTQRYHELTQAIPGAVIHYALKCNPDRPVLEHIKALGGHFEIASYAELGLLRRIGVSPADVLYSNPVKSLREIRLAYKAGVRCFAFQSEDELEKFARVQRDDSRINVYLRIAAPLGESTVASESKFGQSIATKKGQQEALDLIQLAMRLKLTPYGLSFHVGSQMEQVEAWTKPLRDVASFMNKLELSSGVRLRMLDIGGGFPAYHSLQIPTLASFGKAITRELAKLPYQPDKIVLEPGRALVSDAGAMLTEVYGRAFRHGHWWLYLSVGAFNGLMEALETRLGIQFPMVDSRDSQQKNNYIISGPSCDGQDTIASSQLLSADLCQGDRVIIYTTGAYTTAYASRFNGFETPLIKYVS